MMICCSWPKEGIEKGSFRKTLGYSKTCGVFRDAVLVWIAQSSDLFRCCGRVEVEGLEPTHLTAVRGSGVSTRTFGVFWYRL